MNRSQFGRPTRTIRRPRHTLREIADVLGIKTDALDWALRQDANAPKPFAEIQREGMHRTRYYDPDAVLRWYRSRAPAAK